MIDYILFNEKPFELFIDWLRTKNISPETRINDESYQISVPEELDEDLIDEIDEKYDAFLAMNQQLVDQEEKDNSYQMAGVMVTLKDGSVSYADIEPALLGKVLSVVSVEEFGEIVNVIADAVENPQPKSYCQREREAKG